MFIEINQSSLSLFLNQEPTSNFVEMLVFKVHALEGYDPYNYM